MLIGLKSSGPRGGLRFAIGRTTARLHGVGNVDDWSEQSNMCRRIGIISCRQLLSKETGKSSGLNAFERVCLRASCTCRELTCSKKKRSSGSILTVGLHHEKGQE